jgi:hypothetical protein
MHVPKHVSNEKLGNRMMQGDNNRSHHKTLQTFQYKAAENTMLHVLIY